MRKKCVLLLLFSTGCSGYQYRASPSFVPFNEKKGVVKSNISFHTLQIGYSFAQHFSAFATGYKRSGETFNPLGTKENSGEHRTKDTSQEICLGLSYFRKVNQFHLETLVGTGAGSMMYHNTYDLQSNYEFDLKADKNNFFIQPNFGYKKENVEIVLFSRFNYLTYYNIRTTMSAGSKQTILPADSYFVGKQSANLFFAEPGLSVIAGKGLARFHTQISSPINLTANEITSPSIYLRFSCLFNFNLLKTK